MNIIRNLCLVAIAIACGLAVFLFVARQEQKSETPVSKDHPLARAVERQNAQEIAKLIKHGANPNAAYWKDRSLLARACQLYCLATEERSLRHVHRDTIRALIANGAQFNQGERLETIAPDAPELKELFSDKSKS